MDITSLKKPEVQLRANQIKIYLDLFIPSCTIYFKILINYIENQKINKEYIKNENTLRPRQKLKKEEDVINKYLVKYNDLVKGTKVEFSKNDNIRDIFSQGNKNLKDMLFNDYLIFYCIEITNNKFFNDIEKKENPIKFMNLLLQLKFNILPEDNYIYENDFQIKETYIETHNDFDLEKFAEIFLFLEAYKEDITYILEIYCLLNSKLSNIYDTIKDIIESKEIITEISDRNPYYKKRVNEIFYIIIESFLKSLYKNKDKIFLLEDFNYYSFFDSLTLVEATLNKINQKFYLYSNEIYSLRNLISLYKIFKNDLDIKNIMNNIITIIETDNEELQNKNFNKLKNNISQIKQIISQKFGENSDELADYMSKLLREQFRKIDDQDYKFDLLKFAFESDKLI